MSVLAILVAVSTLGHGHLMIVSCKYQKATEEEISVSKFNFNSNIISIRRPKTRCSTSHKKYKGAVAGERRKGAWPHHANVTCNHKCITSSPLNTAPGGGKCNNLYKCLRLLTPALVTFGLRFPTFFPPERYLKYI